LAPLVFREKIPLEVAIVAGDDTPLPFALTTAP